MSSIILGSGDKWIAKPDPSVDAPTPVRALAEKIINGSRKKKARGKVK
jgi:hypothetical protein